MKKYDVTIANILENFDFRQVYAYMKLTGWTYFDSEETPTIVRLTETARNLLESAFKNKSWSEAGGFRAEFFGGSGEPDELSLKFIMTEKSEYV